jgi:hypothetical protein
MKETIQHSMADFCKNTCPACVNARKKQAGLSYKFVTTVEGTCPLCRAYKDVYGKLAHEPLDAN